MVQFVDDPEHHEFTLQEIELAEELLRQLSSKVNAFTTVIDAINKGLDKRDIDTTEQMY